MKVLLVGSGAREHAIAWKLLRDDPSMELICAPGNAGIADIADVIPVKATDIAGLASFARRANVDLTVVGPEASLEAGIVDLFQSNEKPIFGPTTAAAEIETSKRFAKSLMFDAGVPTARASHFRDADLALEAAAKMGTPLVIKASGLAAGKGVIIARSSEEVERAVNMMLRDCVFGDAGSEILLEEFMGGEELSVFAITDGTAFLPMLAAQDHKRLFDGDLGPNTGGMGAYSPVSIATPGLLGQISDTVFEPTLVAMREAGRPFKGLLYAGLMLTDDGPKVIEFNCRFGDPETEALLPLMKSSLLDLMTTVATGGSLANAAPIVWSDQFAMTTVLAAHGYPDEPRIGDEIRMPASPRGVCVFHGSTKRDGNTDQFLTAGGRILAITGTGASVQEAAKRSQSFAETIGFDGKQFRRDIGRRELERHAGAA
ncbi:MAG: phosphoribosylamine--glycine ligase [Gemmatimonadaceae bacterium]